MRLYIFLLNLLFAFPVFSQFAVHEPLVNTGIYAITDSVYMDPNGDDTNPGTFVLPVKSFSAAMQKLPFGVAGVNGGNAYGLIKMKPGFYHTSTGFVQQINNWKNGNVFRNISIEGIGEVVIDGTAGAFVNAHLLILSGNHIFIKNIKLKYTKGIGVLLSRNDSAFPRQSNVLIENVLVDSVGSFSMLLTNIDSVMVRNSASLYSSRPGNDSLTSPCQWPSGIKFLNCHEGIIHDCEIAYSRGEGLNFQNSLQILAYHNSLHDNGLNLYNDNSAKLIIRSNHIYNTPGIGTQYWRNCPADTGKIWAGAGILVANEGSCILGNLPGFSACQTKCILPNESFPNVDSMFIYNNILQNLGQAIGFWEGATNTTGINCIRNVFIFNNTVIGVLGMAGAGNQFLVKAFFPDYNLILNSYYGYLQNVKITNNIFTWDTVAYPNMQSVYLVFHPQHPGPKDITFNNNLWIKGHAYLGATDLVRNTMPGSTYLLTDSLNTIQPCPQNPFWMYNGTKPFAILNDDYLDKSRNTATTNVGALEYSISCISGKVGINALESIKPELFPNPCMNCKELNLKNLYSTKIYSYKIISFDGMQLQSGLVKNNKVELENKLHGIYVLLLQSEENQYMFKMIISED